MYNSPGVKIWDSVEVLIRKSWSEGFKKRPIIPKKAPMTRFRHPFTSVCTFSTLTIHHSSLNLYLGGKSLQHPWPKVQS
jgi:hypothetical protein